MLQPATDRATDAPNPAAALLRALAELDESVLRCARAAGGDDRVAPAVRRISALGEHAVGWLALGAAGALVDRRRRHRWRRATRAVAVSYGLNTALKLVVRRRRPNIDGLEPLTSTATRLSFPSAHATTSFAAARAYSALLPAAPLYAAATLMACTRLALGVHYPSDVAAGALLGTAVGGVPERRSSR